MNILGYDCDGRPIFNSDLCQLVLAFDESNYGAAVTALHQCHIVRGHVVVQISSGITMSVNPMRLCARNGYKSVLYSCGQSFHSLIQSINRPTLPKC